MYKADNIVTPTSNPEQLKVVTWNIRWGCGRLPWFGDSCGEVALADYDSVEKIMEKIADSLNAMEADIVLLQEVDIESKRSGFMDQVQFLLDNTNLNYGAFATRWEVDFVFSNGLGRVHDGNAILSKYEITDAERIKLSLRTDLDTLVNYGYARRNIIKAKFPGLSQNGKDFYAVNTHATAFATDDTKQKHINKYLETKAPWTAFKNGNIEDVETTLYISAECLRVISEIFYPLMPKKMAIVRESLGLTNKIVSLNEIGKYGQVLVNSKIHQPDVLFPRIEIK